MRRASCSSPTTRAGRAANWPPIRGPRSRSCGRNWNARCASRVESRRRARRSRPRTTTRAPWDARIGAVRFASKRGPRESRMARAALGRRSRRQHGEHPAAPTALGRLSPGARLFRVLAGAAKPAARPHRVSQGRRRMEDRKARAVATFEDYAPGSLGRGAAHADGAARVASRSAVALEARHALLDLRVRLAHVEPEVRVGRTPRRDDPRIPPLVSPLVAHESRHAGETRASSSRSNAAAVAAVSSIASHRTRCRSRSSSSGSAR